MELPIDLLESLSGVKGFNRESFCRVHDSGEQVISLRWNPAKFNPDFLAEFPDAEKVPWSTQGFYLPKRPSFILDPLWHAGAYYVQDASSMFLEQVLRSCVDLSDSLRVLDLCAAPGGKSTLLQSLLGENSLLVSNEVIKSRAVILEENITKWGCANVIITQNDPGELGRLEEYFDVIVADVPCSGSGLFRKDPSALAEWSTAHVNHCAARQKRILSDVLSALSPGGILIYSTCSYSPEEDEKIADFLALEFSMEPVSVETDKSWNIHEAFSAQQNVAGYRFFPDQLKGEGFYIAAFRKPGSRIPQSFSAPANLRKLTASDFELAQSFCAVSDHLFFFNDSKEVRYWTPSVQDGILHLQKAAYIKKAGIRAGEIIRESFIPDPEWAFSGMAASQTPTISLNKQQALDYLRLMAPESGNTEPGWYLTTYKGVGLGWIKAMEGRVNNYYPRSWRILNK